LFRSKGGRDGDEIAEQLEELLLHRPCLHQPTFRIASRCEVTAAVVFSVLRGRAGGIFCCAGRPQPGSATSLPFSMTILPLTIVRIGPPCTFRPILTMVRGRIVMENG